MHFDTSTTLISICTIIAVLGLQYAFFWLRDRNRSAWLGWFASAYIFAAGALLLYFLPGQVDPFITFGIGDALRITAFAFLWNGAREFVGRRPEQHVVLFVLAVWLALCSMPQFMGSMGWRLVVASAMTALFCGLSAWELWRNRAEQLPSLTPAIATYVSFAVLSALRIPLVALTPFPVGAIMPIDPYWLAASGLVVFAHATFLGIVAVSLTRERNEQARRLESLLDPLTGLLNRRAFMDEVKARSRNRDPEAEPEPVALLMLDLDRFKTINDMFGHDIGDQVLTHFAGVARRSTRPSDRLFRMGGEEFCFVLPGLKPADARNVAERIRLHFCETATVIGGRPVAATVSVGVAVGTHEAFDLEVLLAAADAAVYQAKSMGRNQTVIADTSALLQRADTDSATAAAA